MYPLLILRLSCHSGDTDSYISGDNSSDNGDSDNYMTTKTMTTMMVIIIALIDTDSYISDDNSSDNGNSDIYNSDNDDIDNNYCDDNGIK